MNKIDVKHSDSLTEQSRNALSTLSVLTTVTDRVSHSMRTNLSVSLGALDDLANGFTLSSKDLSDAHSCLKGIVETLESLKELSSRSVFSPSLLSFREIVSEQLLLNFGFSSDIRINGDVQSKASEKYLDRKLLTRAIRSVLRYAVLRLERFPESLAKEKIINLQLAQRIALDETEKIDWIAIQFTQGISPDLASLKSVSTWQEVAQVDHSPDALGLIFAEQVIVLHGGKTRFHLLTNNQLVFEATL